MHKEISKEYSMGTRTNTVHDLGQRLRSNQDANHPKGKFCLSTDSNTVSWLDTFQQNKLGVDKPYTGKSYTFFQHFHYLITAFRSLTTNSINLKCNYFISFKKNLSAAAISTNPFHIAENANNSHITEYANTHSSHITEYANLPSQKLMLVMIKLKQPDLSPVVTLLPSTNH